MSDFITGPSTVAVSAFDDVSRSTRERIWHGRLPMTVDRLVRVLSCLQVPEDKWAQWMHEFDERRRRNGRG
jgi:hypothetical protein